MTTDEGKEVQVEVQAEPSATLSSWYVGLAQLPGLPVKLRLEVFAIVSATLQQMPVFARRNHFWANGSAAAAFAAEDSDDLLPAIMEAPDLPRPQSQARL